MDIRNIIDSISFATRICCAYFNPRSVDFSYIPLNLSGVTRQKADPEKNFHDESHPAEPYLIVCFGKHACPRNTTPLLSLTGDSSVTSVILVPVRCTDVFSTCT